MSLSTKRIFIKHLPETATKSEIENIFCVYGKVVSVEIKERKDVNLQNQSQFFAYINMEIDDANLQKCFKSFANNLWHGQYTELQIAKESFLERLKREREESNKTTKNEVIEPVVNGYSDQQSNISKKKKIFNDTKNEQLICDDTPKKDRKQKIAAPEAELISPSNSSTKINNSLKRKTIFDEDGNDMSITVDEIFPKINPVTPKKNEKKQKITLPEAEVKRKESVKKMIKDYQQQKCTIQAALSNIDSKFNNKIVFNPDNEPQELYETTTTAKNKTNKSSLFESDEDSHDEDNFNFEVKPLFEGEKGKQLMELQSRYKNDKRFTLDERFINDEDDVEQNQEDNIDNHPEMSMEEEKQKQFEILEQVLGNKIKTKRSTEVKQQNRKGMLRFDPTQPDHLKYEISKRNEEADGKKSKKIRKEVVREDNAQSELSQPKVSKEIFYKIDNLKEQLHDTQGFGLLEMFGRREDEDNPEEQNQNNTEIAIEKNNLNGERNPFRYDSSEDEADDVANKESSKAPEENESVQEKTVKFWTEPFFFKDDDFRLQDGHDFILKIGSGDSSQFGQLRRNLKDIVKAKVKNNQKRNKPFKNKLGGNKKKRMLRIKKALNR